MNKNKKVIGLILSVVAVIVIISCIFIFKTANTKSLSQESVQTLLSNGASLHSFKTDNKSTNIIINGNLDETALIDLSKKVSSMKKAPENINISVTNADSVDLNSFYTEGLILTSTINTKSKSADISSFKKSELTKDYEMKVSDYKYGDIENTDKTAIINISSSKLTESDCQNELVVFANIVKNLNSDLDNIIVNCNVSDKTYSISTNDKNILKTTQQYKL